MIIDAHVHVFRSASEDPERTVDLLAPPDRAAPLEMLEEAMTAAGVDGAVLVPLGPEDGYVGSILADHPAPYAGIAVADPAAIDPGRISERLGAAGFSGLRLFGLAGDPDSAPWVPLLERLAADGHVLWLYPPAEDLDTIDRVATRIPHLRIVLNHCGFTQAGIGRDRHGRPRIDSPVPQPHQASVLALARHPNLAVVISGAYAFSHVDYPYPDVGEVVARLADTFGTDRLLWASDFPWIVDRPGYGECLELVDHHLPGLSASERAAVLGGNCARLLDRWAS